MLYIWLILIFTGELQPGYICTISHQVCHIAIFSGCWKLKAKKSQWLSHAERCEICHQHLTHHPLRDRWAAEVHACTLSWSNPPIPTPNTERQASPWCQAGQRTRSQKMNGWMLHLWDCWANWYHMIVGSQCPEVHRYATKIPLPCIIVGLSVIIFWMMHLTQMALVGEQRSMKTLVQRWHLILHCLIVTARRLLMLQTHQRF